MEWWDFIAHIDKVLIFGHYRGGVKSTGPQLYQGFHSRRELGAGRVVEFREHIASDDVFEAFPSN